MSISSKVLTKFVLFAHFLVDNNCEELGKCRKVSYTSAWLISGNCVDKCRKVSYTSAWLISGNCID